MSAAREFWKELKRMPGTKPLQFERLVAGAFEVSIQASRYHYSRPQMDLPAASYSAWELGIFRGDEWVLPRQEPALKGSPLFEDFEDGDTNSVAAYVPTDRVQAILAALEALP